MQGGTVVDWGSNFKGLLGYGSFNGPETCEVEGEAGSCSRSPVAVQGLSEVTAVATGSDDTAAMAIAGGAVMTWGGNGHGQLGDGGESPSDVPVHACQAFSFGPCPGGPYLTGEVGAIAVGGQHDLVDVKRSSSASIAGVSPATGPGRGGTRVTIAGAHLESASAVHFGAAPASELEVRSSSEIVAVSPPGSGVVDITVTTPEGTTHTTPADRFTFEASTVTGVSPAAGPAAGASAVTITGTRFTGASSVHFGAAAAGEYEVRSPTEILAVSPPGSGAVDVTVTTPEGTSSASPADRFTYQSAPTVATKPADTVKLGSATLNATVDPEGASVSECRFEYGTSVSYGASAPCSSSPGAGSSPVPVSAAISGLSAGGEYHYRIIATNALGTAYGDDQTFATPASELPELGRCVKLAAKTGAYAKAGCTTASVGEHDGGYEWQQGPGPHAGFTAKAGTVTIEFAGTTFPLFRCAEGTLTGSYTGPQSASLSLVLSGCKSMSSGNPACHSQGAEEGQITAAPQARLGIVATGKKPALGWDLQGAGGATLASFQCAGSAYSLAGSVIGLVSGVDAMSPGFSLAFATNGHRQAPQGFLGAFTDTLTAFYGSEQIPVTLTTSISIAGEEPLELKAIA